ncbi:MAG: TetR family transcriptional regulator [Hoeflea sp.]|uniref:TetR/AcrR family transcriptional regulator n=1 Tax=Hoeflea sp. TaxID=1940281 RepID=UPI001D5F1329|nr:TetR family transcriptional regulator [Hoeflea sp.]MBU4529830.1 TetR family transcriptional regulator [Alphaproteobacteria bacterium]MBU4547149.1 TetR family transcriptional regulator [Alphaproteobacteria bacterium]MBU4548762.1 TetR family transcriptional regulator [Alphaproteobacteria bacterium]MBV1722323.1 TetR family transcriptional regulator [Hoeflea sp.]MBV1762520.1 TetR family transcriptional regulator [Hoeflea sp.]
MTENHQRRKQPDLVRRNLLEHAMRLAESEGLSGVTVQAVAAAAGVTKGGLFHHFPSKQALIEAMFADVMARLDADIEAHIAADGNPKGCFTRAYVETMLAGKTFGLGTPWSSLAVSMIMEPSLGLLWTDWLQDRLDRHHDTDAAPHLEIIRLAADGAWLAHLGLGEKALDIDALRRRLLAMAAGR